jgi:hypothetical protein
VTKRGAVYLIDVYAKNEKEDLTDAEIRQVRKIVAALEGQE